MKLTLSVALLVFAPTLGSVFAAEQVLLVNGTITDIRPDGGNASAEIQPGRKMKVPASQLRALRFGQEVLEYGDKASDVLLKQSVKAVQALPDGCLYLVPSAVNGPMKTPPTQPAGFPLCPTKRIDLI